MNKKLILGSIPSVMFLLSMFVSSSFAWFTDFAVNSGNRVQSGNLSVGFSASEVLNHDQSNLGGVIQDLKVDNDPIFNLGNAAQPGDSQEKYFRIRNEGNIAINYQVDFVVRTDSRLAEVILFEIQPLGGTSQMVLGTAIDNGVYISLRDTTLGSGGLIRSSEEVPQEYEIWRVKMFYNPEANNDYNDSSLTFEVDIKLTAWQFNYPNSQGGSFESSNIGSTSETTSSSLNNSSSSTISSSSFDDSLIEEISVPEQVTLSFADWGNQDFNQRMIDLFEVKYPHITVDLRQDIVGSGDFFAGNLVTAAQAGLLPDVFAIDNIPTLINAGLTMDIAEFWDEDPDADLVYDNISFAGVYNGKRYAMPSHQFLRGILINLDIFENANLQTVAGQYRIDNDGYPVKDWTFTEFVNIAKAIKNFDLVNTENLVVGMDTWYGSPDFQQVWPTMDNTATQYDTWDGTQFNYTSSSWISAMQAKLELHQLTDGTTSRFTAEDAEENDVLNKFLIQNGYAAMDIEGSWQFWVIKDAIDNRDFDLGFWPYPQGSAGLFPPTILDFQAVSSQTEHPEEAYLLAKWMTFGRDGWDARLSLMEEDREEAIANGLTPDFLDRFPIADYPNIWTRVRDLVDGIEGIDAIFDRIEYSKPDLDKWLPGYRDFWAWVYDPNNPYSWHNLVAQGTTAVPTFAAAWQNYINQLVNSQISIILNN